MFWLAWLHYWWCWFRFPSEEFGCILFHVGQMPKSTGCCLYHPKRLLFAGISVITVQICAALLSLWADPPGTETIMWTYCRSHHAFDWILESFKITSFHKEKCFVYLKSFICWNCNSIVQSGRSDVSFCIRHLCGSVALCWQNIMMIACFCVPLGTSYWTSCILNDFEPQWSACIFAGKIWRAVWTVRWISAAADN